MRFSKSATTLSRSEDLSLRAKTARLNAFFIPYLFQAKLIFPRDPSSLIQEAQYPHDSLLGHCELLDLALCTPTAPVVLRTVNLFSVGLGAGPSFLTNCSYRACAAFLALSFPPKRESEKYSLIRLPFRQMRTMNPCLCSKSNRVMPGETNWVGKGAFLCIHSIYPAVFILSR